MMVGNDVVPSEESVKLDGIEAIGGGVGRDTMNDEINIVGKLFDFGVVAVFSTVFDREG
jgi:hypothetical protein